MEASKKISELAGCAIRWSFVHYSIGNKFPIGCFDFLLTGGNLDFVLFSPNSCIVGFIIIENLDLFRADTEFLDYLKEVDLLYFVFPAGLISLDTFSEIFGIIEVTELEAKVSRYPKSFPTSGKDKYLFLKAILFSGSVILEPPKIEMFEDSEGLKPDSLDEEVKGDQEVLNFGINKTDSGGGLFENVDLSKIEGSLLAPRVVYPGDVKEKKKEKKFKVDASFDDFVEL